MILLGFGAGMAFNPLLLAAMSDVAPEQSGLASGVVNTAFMMGGALGLAVLASLASSRTDSLAASGRTPPGGAQRRLSRRVPRRRVSSPPRRRRSAPLFFRTKLHPAAEPAPAGEAAHATGG